MRKSYYKPVKHFRLKRNWYIFKHGVENAFRGVRAIFTGRAEVKPDALITVVPPMEEVKEVGWFTSKNNIMEGAWEAPPIEASSWKHVNRYIFPIEQEYKGYMIQAEDREDFWLKAARIDEGEDHRFYTVKEFQEKFYPKPVLDEPVEQYENDIEFLAQKQMPKPDYETKTVTLNGKEL